MRKKEDVELTVETDTAVEGNGEIEAEAASETNSAVEANAAAEPDNGEVEIRLFKDNDKYKNPVFVAVNGKAYMIERGKYVKVPKAVAEVLRNSEIQLENADRVMERAVQMV